MRHLQIFETFTEGIEDLVDLVPDGRRINLDLVVAHCEFAQEGFGNLTVGRDDDLAGFAVHHIQRNLFAEENVCQRFGELLVQFGELLLELVLHLFFPLVGGGGLGYLLVLRRHLHVHHNTSGAAGHTQGRVFHVRRLLTEDGSQQALFGGQLGFALGRDFTHENITRLHFSSHTHDAIRPEIRQGFLAHIRNITGDFLGTQLGVPRRHFVFGNVHRSEHIILHDTPRDGDGVLKVVAVPRHERDEHIFTER